MAYAERDQGAAVLGDYSRTQHDRAVALAACCNIAKKIMTELGLWVFSQ